MEIKSINIFDYTDYRKFLNDCFEAKKALDKHFTYGRWAKEIGLSSISGLTMILNGQRHAGKQIISLLIENLKLTDDEKEHFQKLIKLQKQAKDDSSLVMYMMDNLKLEEKVQDELRPLQFKWQMGFLREAIKWQDFQGSDEYLSHKCRFPVDKGQLENILNEMINEGMIKEKNYKYSLNQSYQSSPVDIRYFQYLHKEFLRMIDQAYEFDFVTRALEYRMIVIKKERLAEAKQRINKMLNEFIQEFDSSKEDSNSSDVYLTSLHFIPLSK